MKKWLQRFLGISEILRREELIHDLAITTEYKISNLTTEIKVHNRVLGRIIVKLDPNYAGDELDPARKAESDRISDEVIKRLYAEHEASNRFPT